MIYFFSGRKVTQCTFKFVHQVSCWTFRHWGFCLKKKYYSKHESIQISAFSFPVVSSSYCFSKKNHYSHLSSLFFLKLRDAASFLSCSPRDHTAYVIPIQQMSSLLQKHLLRRHITQNRVQNSGSVSSQSLLKLKEEATR